MSSTKFNPERSAAIRQLLLDTVADGLALFASSYYGDSSEACPVAPGTASLTMVDTSNGKLIWSRQWDENGKTPYKSDLSILGKSNRALFYPTGDSGTQDVIDLATGTTLTTVPAPAAFSGFQLTPIWDESGDVIYTKPTLDATGNTVGVEIERVNPLDMSNPTWVTPVQTQSDGGYVRLESFTTSGLVPLTYVSPNTKRVENALIDLTTGTISNISADDSYEAFSNVLVGFRDDVDGSPQIIGANRDSGKEAWAKPYPLHGAVLAQVSKLADRPGSRDFTGDLAILTPTTLTVFDGESGAVNLTADVTHCGIDTDMWSEVSPEIVVDEARNSLIINLDNSGTCLVDRSSGKPTPIIDHDSLASNLFGPQVTYVNVASMQSGGISHAYARASGQELWSTPVVKGEQWKFAGGVLIRQIGNHIESMG